MLFDSSLRKELGRSFGATLVVLVTIVMTVMLIRTLGQASVGRVNPSEVLLVMGFTVLGHLPTILTLSLFIAITATLTRMYAASEMVVWFASGQGLLTFLKPVLRFAWPVLLAVAVLALLVWPWSNQQIRELRDRYQARGDIERVAPGRFIESAGGQRVFFIDKDTADAQTGHNIFITTTERGKETVTSAQSGRLDTLNGERFIILENGHRLETDLQTGETRISQFAEYGNRVSQRMAGPAAADAPSMKPTPALLREPTPRHLGELSWRLGLALAALNCVIFALAATRVNPRVGRSAGLVYALFAFVTYYNLINFGENWIGRERIGFVPYVVVLHGGIFVLAMGWLLARQNDWLSRWRLRRSRNGGAA
ncbi:LPS export ABC transporter permease LptF [Ottowia sp.]|uniref:LPS export ABC transporter permease LptF n=1 Tax=Ottowia sp. TaxID=1898956 RepID=UPI002B54378B|nr:LPS export ABC transporter permease LptF [Ottowia sp.]HOB65548.1 LPS export ABC transporter permease LptF [Ottowia sp.]HPZ58026.1 LPS export ABC transporter permease LptF [Ottowia sp.]HQD46650.1 LPS export ABC transporter permease LptF [Ottowia sp.]